MVIPPPLSQGCSAHNTTRASQVLHIHLCSQHKESWLPAGAWNRRGWCLPFSPQGDCDDKRSREISGSLRGCGLMMLFLSATPRKIIPPPYVAVAPALVPLSSILVLAKPFPITTTGSDCQRKES